MQLDTILLILLGICGILYAIMRPYLKEVMLKYDDSYTGWPNNTYDMYRILRVLIKNKDITKDEKYILLTVTIAFFISLSVGIILIFIFKY